jgi:hypothetical protein
MREPTLQEVIDDLENGATEDLKEIVRKIRSNKNEADSIDALGEWIVEGNAEVVLTSLHLRDILEQCLEGQ